MRAIHLAIFLILTGCAPPKVPDFNGQRAFDDLLRQVELGPRIPGETGHSQCAIWIQNQLRPLADSLWTQDFRGTRLGSPDSVSMLNIIARFNPAATSRVLIGAHWDTRPLADLDPNPLFHDQPVPGANDGASGVAVLIELARLFDSLPPPVGVDLVFFDGEDGGDYGTQPGQWCQGSFHFASHLPTKYRWAIIVDMIGDKDLQLPVEGNSFRLAPDLVNTVWTKAAELGETAFQYVRGVDIFDDHMPLLAKGIPAIDIIDFDYPHWHTTDDTPDKCSPASLQTVGRVVVAVIYEL